MIFKSCDCVVKSQAILLQNCRSGGGGKERERERERERVTKLHYKIYRQIGKVPCKTSNLQ